MAGNDILALGLLLLAGFGAGKMAASLGLPRITGYLLAGILLGPSSLNLVDTGTIHDLSFINSIALALIALSVGAKLRISVLRGVVRHILTASLMEVFLSGIVVFFLLRLSGIQAAAALLLGISAMSTSPATVIAVVEESRAAGQFTTTLLGVMAMADLISLCALAVVLGILPLLLGTASDLSILSPFLSLAGSILLGAAMGWGLSRLAPRTRDRQEFLIVILGTAFLTSELAQANLEFHPILINMTVGFVLVNLCAVHEQLGETLEMIHLPVYVAFFALQGAKLPVSILATVGLTGVLYVAGRVLAKVAGAWLGGHISGAPPACRNFLGLSLMPQSGIALGMAATIQRYPHAAAIAPTVTAVVLLAVFFNELIGPVAVKFALSRSGESSRSHTGGSEPRGTPP